MYALLLNNRKPKSHQLRRLIHSGEKWWIQKFAAPLPVSVSVSTQFCGTVTAAEVQLQADIPTSGKASALYMLATKYSQLVPIG